MKASDLRPRTKDELKTELGNLRKEAFNLRFQKAGGQLPGDRQPTQLIFLHHVLDTLIDSYFPTLSAFDDRIDDLQMRIFTRPTDDDLQDLFSLQRSLVGLRTLVITAGDPAELDELLAPYAGEFELLVQPRRSTTTFITSGLGLERTQRRAEWAK